MKKGQVSSEYMLILAVVLVLAIAAIVLLRDVLLTGGSVNQQQSRAYWAVSNPFSISAHKYQGNQLDMDVQSILPENAEITSMSVEGSSFTLNHTFAPGGRRVVTLTLGIVCGSTGDLYSLEDIQITYVRSGDSARIQHGETPLVGTCS